MKCITSAIRKITSAITRRWAALRREYIVEQYVRSGAVFGEALSYLYMGECVGFHGMKERWTQLERLYAGLGYRTISLESFVEYGGYGKAIDHLVRVKRADDEQPVFHSVTFQQRYAQGILPELDHPHDGEPTQRTCKSDGRNASKKKKGSNSCDCGESPPKSP
jgi:hypothetical protein